VKHEVQPSTEKSNLGVVLLVALKEVLPAKRKRFLLGFSVGNLCLTMYVLKVVVSHMLKSRIESCLKNQGTRNLA
jgi:hypothetical protein